MRSKGSNHLNTMFSVFGIFHTNIYNFLSKSNSYTNAYLGIVEPIGSAWIKSRLLVELYLIFMWLSIQLTIYIIQGGDIELSPPSTT